MGGDIAAGDVAFDNRAQQMQAGVKAHQAMAGFPIQFGRDGIADCWQVVILGDYMQGFAAVAVLDRGCDRHFAAIGGFENSDIPGLAASGGVEHGLVEFDAAVRDRDDLGVAVSAIGVFTKQKAGHRLLHTWWRSDRVTVGLPPKSGRSQICLWWGWAASR